jgi:hypothetical protein
MAHELACELTHEERRQLALAFIERETAAGNLHIGYREIAAHLTEETGRAHTPGMVAGLLSRYGKRKHRAGETELTT